MIELKVKRRVPGQGLGRPSVTEPFTIHPGLEDDRLSEGCVQFSNGYVYFSLDYWKKMAKVLRSAGHHLIPVKENLVDKIWTDRPERPCKPLLTLGLDYTGHCPVFCPCMPLP